jgi:uncharacterized membrane protein
MSQEESLSTPTPNPKRKRRAKRTIWGIQVALLAVWAALVSVAAALPAIPVPGMAGLITITVIMSAISGVILGPAAAVAEGIGGVISQTLFPYSAFFGPVSFLSPLTGGLVGGLVFAKKWQYALAIQLGLIAAWFSHPNTWTGNMWLVLVPYHVLAPLFIAIPPIRNWARKAILDLNTKSLLPAMIVFSIIGHSAHFLLSNVFSLYMYNLPWQYWIPTWAYWMSVDTAIIVVSGILGSALVLGLRKARIPTAMDIFRD